MGLRDVELREDNTYNSIQDNPAMTFFLPCFKEAVTYDRAVGYFRSSVFSLIGDGFEAIARKDGKIRIIASPHLDESDIEKINNGYEIRKAADEALIRELDVLTDRQKLELGYLGRLIAQGHLDFKIAVTRVGNSVGLYHDKFGIISDGSLTGRIVFSGSNNETYPALRQNSETFTVFKEWDSPQSRLTVNRFVDDFEKLWTGRLAGVEVYELPELTFQKIREFTAQLPPEYEPEFVLPDRPVLPTPAAVEEDAPARELGVPQIPAGVKMRDYQLEAIDAWFANRGKGIFKMATGTGKTITALALVSKFFETFKKQGQPLLLVVVCPRLNLVDQWAENLESFGVSPIKCYDGYTTWINQANGAVLQLNLGGPRFETLVVTNDTFRREHFQQVLENCQREIILIGDEAHNFGSQLISQKLPEKVNYRLGLSATPERFREEETQVIFDYFGEPIFELDLKTAIDMGALSQYKYFPIPTFLDSEEMEKYVELAKEIGRIYAIKDGGMDDGDESRLGRLLGERAMVLGHCSGKIAAFKKEARRRDSSMFQLAFCAEGSPPLRDGEPQINEIQKFVGTDMGKKVRKYVNETTKTERAEILQRFSSGTDLQYLLSMHCLDEGVDIPDARVAYILASSRNPRQSVQRRGRILRKPADGSTKIAEIIDFLALPTVEYMNSGGDDVEIEKRLIVQELQRARDFAGTAVNCDEAMLILDDLITRFGIEEEAK